MLRSDLGDNLGDLTDNRGDLTDKWGDFGGFSVIPSLTGNEDLIFNIEPFSMLLLFLAGS